MNPRSLLRIDLIAAVVVWSAVASTASGAVVGQIFEKPIGVTTKSFRGDQGPGFKVDDVIYRAFWVATPYTVDIDGNGTTDFTIVGSGRTTIVTTMKVSLTGNNSLWSYHQDGGFDIGSEAVAITGGTLLGPSLRDGNANIGWHNDDDTMAPSLLTGANGLTEIGDFLSRPFPTRHYLGVRFERDGALHYGWLGLSELHTGEDFGVHLNGRGSPSLERG